jgi:hypothetical protein
MRGAVATKLLHGDYLAMTLYFFIIPINCRSDLHILHGHLWGRRFQMSVIGERQVTGGNRRSFSGGMY